MAVQDFTPADRIRQLSEIGNEAAMLVQHAALAINALTNNPLDVKREVNDEDALMSHGNKSDTLPARREAYQNHSKAYFDGLQRVVVHLRRQIYAQEEAGLITPEALGLSTSTQARPQPQPNTPAARGGVGNGVVALETERVTNGGMGNLDIGYLNSRGNKVGVEKEAELVKDTKQMLKELLSRSDTAKGAFSS